VPTSAAVLCPEGADETTAASLEHCEACGYHFYGIVRDWNAAYDLLRAGLVEVIVVSRRETWSPRIEYAERRNQRTITAAGTANTRWRRARVVRRYR
jgi:transposase